MKTSFDAESQAEIPTPIVFQTSPNRYRHWKLKVEHGVAWLSMNVDAGSTLADGYELKSNSYDLSVDIELNDAVQRLRFEHPEVGCVVIRSAKDRIFCAGANIQMLGQATHGHKVNFCKFTNETRNAMEDASRSSGQTYLCAIEGACAGGGYELALACEEIIMVDDGNTSVSLPEIPLLAVLPGTGGLTRLIEKRRVRRDHADYFCTLEEGLRGSRAAEWRFVDEVVPLSSFHARVRERAEQITAQSRSAGKDMGISLLQLKPIASADTIVYENLEISIDQEQRCATFEIGGPSSPVADSYDDCVAAGSLFWPLAVMRELDDAILHLRFNAPDIGTWIFKSTGDPKRVLAYDRLLEEHVTHWFAREILLHTRRVLKRLEVSSRSLIAVIEPGSCFAGSLFEFVLVADQSYMLSGHFEGEEKPPATVALSASNFDRYQMVTGLSRLATRFQHEPLVLDELRTNIEIMLEAKDAWEAGIVTFILDDIDWEGELRMLIEARARFSPDALSGMEANLRFPGPETMESKIFARLSAWQNWIFQRPNAVGENGALVMYGTGEQPKFSKRRI
jgi:benzoyl-CoA-dihydrodiol lyase